MAGKVRPKKTGRQQRSGSAGARAGAALRPLQLAPPLSVEPCVLLRGDDDEVGRVFLALALVYNDLHGIVVWARWLEDRQPDLSRFGALQGEYRGIAVQGARYSVGLLHELMELIRCNGAVLERPAVSALVSSLNADARGAWDALVDVARGTGTEVGELRTALARIRHNFAFHYYNPKELAHGYLHHFARVATEPSEAYRFAWWSPGTTLPTSRFFYADAAAEGATARVAKQSVTEWLERIGPILLQVAVGLRSLLEAFIRARQASNGASP